MITEIHKFRIQCDGNYPDGRPCPCDLIDEGTDQPAVEAIARAVGWTLDHRGWICNAHGGHQGDQ